MILLQASSDFAVRRSRSQHEVARGRRDLTGCLPLVSDLGIDHSAIGVDEIEHQLPVAATIAVDVQRTGQGEVHSFPGFPGGREDLITGQDRIARRIGHNARFRQVIVQHARHFDTRLPLGLVDPCLLLTVDAE